MADIVKRLQECDGVMVKGDCRYDTFAHETTLMVNSLVKYDIPKREDNSEEKRIELHLHTQMSNLDAVSSATALIQRAAEWGHPAVAVTDHGVVQAYPEAFGAAKKFGIKLIPGVEGYLTDEDQIVRSENEDKRLLDTPIVVLDFETTGLDTRNDRIIEIGAVRLSSGQVTDSLSVLVNPEQILKPKITEITGITDQMLRDQPPITQALPQLIEFIGDCPIAAHNADFDYNILQSELHRQGLTREYTVIDTLTFARKLYPDMKTHKLGVVCKRLGVSLKNAHRAVHDAEATAKCLQQMLEETRKRGHAGRYRRPCGGLYPGQQLSYRVAGRLAAGPVEHQPSGQRRTSQVFPPPPAYAAREYSKIPRRRDRRLGLRGGRAVSRCAGRGGREKAVPHCTVL